jgi:citronellyl-CoA synthetase
MRLLTRKAKHSDVITATDVAERIPKLLKKMPHMIHGLILANDTRPNKPMGFGFEFERATRENPYGIALYYLDVQYTYTQFNEWANKIAHYLLSCGIKKGDVITVLIENRPELLVTSLACAKVGAIAALVNCSQTGKSLIHSVNLVKPKMLIVGDELKASVNEVKDSLELEPNQFYWLADEDTRKPRSSVTKPVPAGYQDLAELIIDQPRFNPPCSHHVFHGDGLFYIYTSGTTGLPKAVVFKHGRWMKGYGTLGFIVNLNKDDVLYATLPFYHATAMVVCWSAVIAGNAGLAIRRKFSAREFWVDARRYNATAIGYVGELCRYLMDSPPNPNDRKNHVTKMVGNGMRANIWHDFKQRFGIDEVFELYGSSEGNVGFSNIFNFENTVGFSPVPYAIVRYDQEKGEPVLNKKGFMTKVKKGESGLLIGEITKTAPFDGYTDPEKNKATILEGVFKKGDKFFNTGDLVRDLGFRHAQFVDRLGDTFRWKGENVSTTEVENHVADHDAICEAVVYGVEIPNTNGRAGMCAITPHPEAEVDYAELLSFFKKCMPAFAIPVFIRVQAQVETTGTFKYQKTNLKKEAFDPSQTQDPLLVWLPGTTTYVFVTDEVFAGIHSGAYRF